MAIKTFWSLSLILLPMVLIFSDNSMANLQTVSIIAAFPIAFIILLIVAAFFKDAKNYPFQRNIILKLSRMYFPIHSG